MSTRTPAPAVPRLTYLRIKNYRALRDVEFRDLTPLTVLIGPNGSGKSTVLDALDFLAEAVRGNMVGAWEKRNRFAGMRTRGSEGNISFELEVDGLLPTRKTSYLLEIA
jgi:predicted ATPase